MRLRLRAFIASSRSGWLLTRSGASASPTFDKMMSPMIGTPTSVSLVRLGRGRAGRECSSAATTEESGISYSAADDVDTPGGSAMQGLMQDVPLTLPHIFERAEKLFFDKEVVTATAVGLERTTYGAWAERTRRLGGVLDDLGVSAGGRVATFGWNTARPLER